MTRLKALFFIVLTIFLRCIWLKDMEFREDQINTSAFIFHLSEISWSPITDFTGNSRLAHSTGFFYLVSWLSGGSSNPWVQVLAIALFNSFPIALGLWFFRSNSVRFLSFAMMAFSPALVLDSRKIWTPDLMAAWSILSLFFFLHGNWLSFLVSGFAIVMGGHMYLPGTLVGAVATLVLGRELWVRNRRNALAWIIGSGLGWTTFIPYFYFLFFRTCEVVDCHAPPREFSFRQVLYLGEALLFLPTPQSVYKTYVGKALDAMWVIFPPAWVGMLVISAGIGFLIWLPLYWGVGLKVIKNWKWAKQDPIVVFTAFLLPTVGLALAVTRLAANHLHYWLGVLPFLYYAIAWGMDQGRGEPCKSSPPLSDTSAMRPWVAWGGVLCFLGLSVSFLILAHISGGVPLVRG